MGKRGPKPKPRAIKERAGNPGRRPLTDDEVQPESLATDPEPPDWLHEVGRAEWRVVVPQLRRLGLLTALDLGMVAAYCSVYARWRAAEAVAVAKPVMTIVTANGSEYQQQRPEVAIANQCLKLMIQIAAQFGMTPSGRSGLQVANPDQAKRSKLADFASRG